MNAVLSQDLQGMLRQRGQEYMIQGGYGINGISFLLDRNHFRFAAAGFFLLSAAGLGMFYGIIHSYQKSVAMDGLRLRSYLDSKRDGRELPEPVIANAEIQIVFEGVKNLLHANRLKINTLNREKERLGEFTQNVYHQIKTPLAGIRLRLEQMEKDRCEIEECRMMLDRLSEQITILLNIGKFEAGALEIPKKEGDLSILVEDAVYALGALAVEKKTEILMELPEEAPYYFNYFWLREAAENLLINCCEHSKPGGKVWIGLRKTGTGYLLQVNDQAGGLKTKRPFDRYVTSGSSGSCGIGLHLARNIIESHFGTIRARDNELGGTEFLISLPVLKGTAPYL